MIAVVKDQGSFGESLSPPKFITHCTGEVCTLALCQSSSQWPLLTSGLLLCGETLTLILAASWGMDHLACLKWGYTLRVKAAWLQEERLQQTKVCTLTDCVFPERTYSAFSLSAAAAGSWSALTPPSLLQNMNRVMKLFYYSCWS